MSDYYEDYHNMSDHYYEADDDNSNSNSNSNNDYDDYNNGEEDGGFVGYVPNTVNPGPLLLIATIAMTLLIMLLLPVAVVLGDKYEEKKKKKKKQRQQQSTSGRIDTSDDDEDDSSDRTNNSTNEQQNKLDGRGRKKQAPAPQHHNNDIDNNDAENISVASSKESFYSTVSEVLKEIMDPQQQQQQSRPIRGGGRHGNRNRRRHRTQIERMLQNPAELYSVEFTKPTTTTTSSREGTTTTPAENECFTVADFPASASREETTVTAEESYSLDIFSKDHESQCSNDGCHDGDDNLQRHHQSFEVIRTACSNYPPPKSNDDNDDSDSDNNNQYEDHHGYPPSSSGSMGQGGRLPFSAEESSDDDDAKPRIDRSVCLSLDGLLDEIAQIMAWDVEMRRIIKLSIPFATGALSTGVIDTLTVGVVGTLIGTREVSALVVVNLLVSLTTQFVGGFHEALATLASQAIGASKPRLAGKYVQIAVVLYSISYVPFACFWAFALHGAIIWLGFDEQTAVIGQQYGRLLLVDFLLDGVSEAIHCLLDIDGHERFSMLMGITEEILGFLIILIWALVGSPSLLIVGLVEFACGVTFLSITVIVIWMKGWFLPYRSGMIGSFALKDKKAVKMVSKTAASLAFGYLLTDGEWEVLTIFASFLGPAEVAAWGIFGTLWDGLNELIDGISDASEVRCAFLLGSDQPERARLSSYKSMMIGIFTSLFTTSILLMCGDDLPTWLTSDPTLQHLLKELLPMFGLGNAALVMGSMSWTLLGAQGRYRLATTIVFLVSWLFTLPMSAVLSIHFRVGLEGQTAAVVVGYVISGAFHSYFLFRSDWVALSQIVMDDNCSRASDDDSLSKDVPTNAEMSEQTDDLDRLASKETMSTRQLQAVNEEMASPSLESAGSEEGGDDPPNPPSRRNLFFRGIGLPNPPSGEGPSSSRAFFSLPNPPSGQDGGVLPTGSFSGEGPALLYTLSGEENDSPKEVEVELCDGPSLLQTHSWEENDSPKEVEVELCSGY